MEQLKIIRKINNGEEPVAVVRIRKMYTAKAVDFSDYTNPRIYAVIPCVKSEGKYISVKTGQEVAVGENDDVRTLSPGAAFVYPDGQEIILNRNWKLEKEFTERRCNSTELRRAFGE